MKKRNILINLKDYNNELETILEKKDFSENVKNLLLSTLYKIETSYTDYKKVKVNVPEKGEFIEEIIKNINENCNKIEIIKPQNSEELRQKDAQIDYNKKEIKVYQNEKKCLQAIYNLSENEVLINDKYYIVKEPLQDFFTQSNITNKMEVLRDFDGWTWNCYKNEITNVFYNLVFQNLLILLGNEFIEEIINNKQYINDSILNLENELEKLYGKQIAKKFKYNFLLIISQIYWNKNNKNRNYLEEEYKNLKKTIKKTVDKEEFIEELSTKKKQNLKQIKKIEEILGDKEKLEKEFIKRNKKDETLFSIKTLKNILNKEKNKLLQEIKTINNEMNPKKFSQKYKEIEEKINFIENVLENNQNEIIIQIQKIFIEVINRKLKKLDSKKDVINAIYIIRYYQLLNFNYETQIFNLEQLQLELDAYISKLIIKAVELKVIELINKDIKFTINIWKEILKLRIIDLENLEILIKKKGINYNIQIFDEESIEYEKSIELINCKELKLNKKIKLLI